MSNTQCRGMHLALLARVEAANNPTLEELLAMYEEYRELTHALNSSSVLYPCTYLHALNARLLSTLLAKALAAFHAEAAVMRERA